MILKHDEIKAVFNISALEIGDILLVNTYDERERRRITGKFNHVMIYVGDARFIDSDAYGVNIYNIYSFGFKTIEDACVRRYEGLSKEQRNGIVLFCRQQMGKEFSTREAYKVPNLKDTNTLDTSNRMFCSRLAAEAYDFVGKRIVENPNYCEPYQIFNSNVLQTVTNGVKLADHNEIHMVDVHQPEHDNGDAMYLANVWNALANVYEIDIQTVDDLLSSAIKRPALDEQAVNVLKKANYLNIDKLRSESFPWLDNSGKFDDIYPTTEDKLWHINVQLLHYENFDMLCTYQNKNVLALYVKKYPNSKVLIYLFNGFKELEALYEEDYKWLINRHLRILDEDPDGFMHYVKTLHEEVEISKNDN